jgi:DNA-binding beta-propeller fold protein YncE
MKKSPQGKPSTNPSLLGLILCIGCTVSAEPKARGVGAENHSVSLSSSIERQGPLSPTALATSQDGGRLYIACASADQIAVLDTTNDVVLKRIALPGPPSGLCISKAGRLLYVTCATPVSTVCALDPVTGRVLDQVAVGHTAMAPVLSPGEEQLFVCNRFSGDVSALAVHPLRELKRVPVVREPVAACVTPDGRWLVVANRLRAQFANQPHLGAAVTMIDTRNLTVAKNIELDLGAGFLNGVAISPNGRFAAITHLRSMYWLSTSGVELGRMNGAALSILDLDRQEVLGMIFLDQTRQGAAMPWGVVWTPDGKTIAVAHAGAHSVSLVDAPLIADKASFSSSRIGDYAPTDAGIAPLPRQRPVRLRRRIDLPANGPRALLLSGSRVYTANYFSDDLCRIDLSRPDPAVEILPLGQTHRPSPERLGEQLFNDARLCFEGWQSCASCHDTDARMDALNWDLLNDGIANPKNTRNLLYAHQSGPAMALGVRANAEEAVRAGIHHILFTEQPEEVPKAMDCYLKSLRPVPSPHLVNGRLSPAAVRGGRLFQSSEAGCVVCHAPPLFTDGKAHDVGTANQYRSMYALPGADHPSARFYSPILLELWRTAPYLHDGSAATLRDVLTTRNPTDRHGHTSQLNAQEIDDLIQYLLAL